MSGFRCAETERPERDIGGCDRGPFVAAADMFSIDSVDFEKKEVATLRFHSLTDTGGVSASHVLVVDMKS